MFLKRKREKSSLIFFLLKVHPVAHFGVRNNGVERKLFYGKLLH